MGYWKTGLLSGEILSLLMESGPVQLLMSFSFICSPNHRAFYKSTFNLSFPFENIVTTVSLLIMSSLHILVPYLQMWGLRAPELSYGRIPPVSHWLELNYPLGVCTCLGRQNGNYHNSHSQCPSPRYGYTYFTHAISTTL